MSLAPQSDPDVLQPEPFLVIRPRRGFPVLPLRELVEFRDLLNTLALRDVKLRYRQTAIGVVWVVLQPLIGAGLFSFVFGSVAKLPTGDTRVPYFAFSFAGLLVWNVFVHILQKSSESMVGNAGLVSKIYFPRMVLPLSSVHGVMIDFLVASVLMAVLMVLYGIAPGVHLLFLPVALLMAVMLALGLGLWAAALNVSYRDVRYVVPVFTQFLMWASPVAYAAINIPDRLQWVVALNPLVGILETFRWSILGTPVANWPGVGYSACVAVAAFAVGSLIFQKAERRFADVI